jgi:hypothetical protein
MNKSYRFVESNSGKSNVTILSLFQALPQTYIRQTLFFVTRKEYRNQNEKMLFLASFLVIIIGFLVIAGFFSCTGWVVFAGFLLFAIILRQSVYFPLLTLVFVCFFFFLG